MELSLTEIAKTAAVSWDKFKFVYVKFEMPIKHQVEMLRATRYSGYKSRLELKNGEPTTMKWF